MTIDKHFVETIRLTDGTARNLNYHQARMDLTASHFFPEVKLPPLKQIVDKFDPKGLNKLRVVYGETGIELAECAPYVVRNIGSLKIVDGGDVDYSFKSTDRTQLNRLRSLAEGCDEVVIIRGGLVTDTSYTNIAIFDGHSWLTPGNPLLRGTKRASLLDGGVITEAAVTVDDLRSAKRIRLFNAMIEFGDIELGASSVR